MDSTNPKDFQIALDAYLAKASPTTDDKMKEVLKDSFSAGWTAHMADEQKRSEEWELECYGYIAGQPLRGRG